MYSVKIIKDSMNTNDDRLTTFELTYPRMVHAELMTHRQFSRNSASSRALPTNKLLEQIENDPVLPKWWGRNQSGMQAREELDPIGKRMAEKEWLLARDQAVLAAKALHKTGVHKQLANRVLEPWMFITVIVTSTEYDNWFALRDHADAQPEIAWVAREMKRLYTGPDVQVACLGPGEDHLPYVELRDSSDPLYIDLDHLEMDFPDEDLGVLLMKISTARCARVSYLTHDGVRDFKKDLELHDRLASSGHWSPFEHVATALADSTRSGNFVGWLQYRKSFDNECIGRTTP